MLAKGVPQHYPQIHAQLPDAHGALGIGAVHLAGAEDQGHRVGITGAVPRGGRGCVACTGLLAMHE